MKRSKFLMIALVAIMGVQSATAQSARPKSYVKISKEQLEALYNEVEANYDAINDKLGKAKSKEKDAKRAYDEAKDNTKALKQQLKEAKAKKKEVKKAWKLRKKLHKLAN